MSIINQPTWPRYGVGGRSLLKGPSKGHRARRVAPTNTMAPLAYNPTPKLCYRAILSLILLLFIFYTFVFFLFFFILFFLIQIGCGRVAVAGWAWPVGCG